MLSRAAITMGSPISRGVYRGCGVTFFPVAAGGPTWKAVNEGFACSRVSGQLIAARSLHRRPCVNSGFYRGHRMFAIDSKLSAWLLLLLAGGLEVLFSVALKFSDGYTRWVPTLVSLSAAFLSLWLMSLTLRVLPLGTAYAVWAGLGAIGTALVGIGFLGESGDPLRLACVGAIVVGIVGLQLRA